MSIELKPCPFCGGEGFVNDDPTGEGIGVLSVECHGCGADSGYWLRKDLAIRSWNTRAERTCHDIGGEAPFSAVFRCSECLTMDFGGTPFFCRNCGAKVVE